MASIRFSLQTLAQPAQFEWRLKIASVDWEKIIGNGVGQVAALALRPVVAIRRRFIRQSFLGFAGPSGPAGPAERECKRGPSGPIPSNLVVTLDTSLMGQPGSTAASLASVGPSVDGAIVALADNGRGLLPDIRYVSTDQADSDGETEKPAVAAERPTEREIGVGRFQAAERLDREATSNLADERALVQGEWLVRLAGVVRDWFGPMSTDARPSLSDFNPVRSLMAPGPGLGPEQRAAAPSRRGGVRDRTARGRRISRRPARYRRRRLPAPASGSPLVAETHSDQIRARSRFLADLSFPARAIDLRAGDNASSHVARRKSRRRRAD